MSERKTAEAPKYANWVVVQKDWEGDVIGVFFYYYKRHADRLTEALACELRTGSIDLLPIKEWRGEKENKGE